MVDTIPDSGLMERIHKPDTRTAEIGALLGSTAVEPSMKGIPNTGRTVMVGDIGEMGWSLSDLVPPVAVLYESALEHNLRVMADYCRNNDVQLAPHGKTTMSPQIISRQLEHGAWGVTLSTPVQVRTLARFGFDRILVAHQIADTAGIAELAATLRAHPELRLYVLVDSVQGVELLDTAFDGSTRDESLGVFVEVGVEGGRTGCRTESQVTDVARTVHRSRNLRLVGVEGYEGLVPGERLAETIEGIDRFLDRLVASTSRLIDDGVLSEERFISAGGSAYFDRVVERFRQVDPTVTPLLRSGCYVAHDHGKYHRLSPLDGRSQGGLQLRPALEVWTSVVSRPERDLAVLNAGRRDLSFDAGLPVAVKRRRRGSGDVESLEDWWEVTRVMDQHAMLRVPLGEDLAIGDLIALGISHPCTTFDKFRVIPVLDDEFHVIDAITTMF